ncbi:hypothetical protein ACG2LH_11820, partial [Zhouia sp. PK063]
TNGLLSDTYSYQGLPGYVATDIAYGDDNYYAVTGDNGVLAKLNKTTHTVEASIDLADLRAVGVDGSKVVILSGTNGLKIYNKDLTLSSSISTPTDVADAKRTIDFYNDYVLVAQGANGLGIYNMGTGSEFENVAIPAYDGDDEDIDPSDIVTNAVSTNGDKVFVANGGAGIAVYNFDTPTTLNFLGSTSFKGTDRTSSNFIKSKNNYVFVASGRGGLKILKMNETSDDDTSGDATCNGTYDAYTGPSYVTFNVNSNDNQSYSGSAALSNMNISATLNWCGSVFTTGHVNVNSNGTFNMYGSIQITQQLNVNNIMNIYGSAQVGDQLNINTNGELYIKGNLTQGDINAKNKKVFVNGKLIIDGDVIFYGDLTINSGGSIVFANSSSTLKVYGKVKNNSGSSAISGGTITEL